MRRGEAVKATFADSDPRQELLQADTEEGSKVLRARSPFIEISLNHIKYNALVDTGSEVSLVSLAVYHLVVGSQSLLAEFRAQGVQVVGAFSATVYRPVRQVLLNVVCNGVDVPYEFLVVSNLCASVILGADFLRSFSGVVNLRDECLQLCIDGLQIRVPEVATDDADTALKLRKVCLVGETLAVLTTSVGGEHNQGVQGEDAVAGKVVGFPGPEGLRVLLKEFADVFSDTPGLTHSYEHKIELSDCTPFTVPQYPIPQAYKQAVQAEVDKMLQWGVIEPAMTPYCCPVLIVPKKTGDIRFVYDARRLNKVLVPDREMPRPIHDILRNLRKARYFSTLDITAGYWQVPLREQDRKYTGFRIAGRSYQYRVLPFGLSTAVSSFSRCMRVVLGDLCDTRVYVYVDDIIIPTETIEEHLEVLRLVFEKIRSANITLRMSKCVFLQSEIKFLGYNISALGFAPDEKRVEAIRRFPKPTTAKNIQAFLGLTGYDRLFVSQFSTVAEPLTRLLRKGVPFRWGEAQTVAFEELKERVASAVLLHRPDWSEPFSMQADASDVGVGAVLWQGTWNERRVVEFYSRTLLPAERNYTVSERELLAIIVAVQHWRQFLMGRHFVVYTDHHALTFLSRCRLLNPRLARWSLAMQEFDFRIEYIPGRDNVIPDVLSRFPMERISSPDNRVFRVGLCVSNRDDSFSRENFKLAQRRDPKLSAVISDLEGDASSCSRYILHESLLYIENRHNEFRLCVPVELVDKVVILYHEQGGHYGAFKTALSISRDLWFRNIVRKAKQIVPCCEICQRMKSAKSPVYELEPILPDKPDDLVAIDFFGPLPKSTAGVQYIYVMLDAYTKHVALYPMKRATALAAINRTMTYFREVGRPSRMLCDHGTQFTSGAFKKRMAEEGVRLVFCSIRHPQGNPAERVMRELGRLLRTYCSENHVGWCRKIPRIASFINNVPHLSTGFAPVELHFGAAPRSPLADLLPVEFRSPGDNHVKLFWAGQTMRYAAEMRALSVDKLRPVFFEVGDEVLVKSNRVSSAAEGVSRKMLPLYKGPYKVSKRTHTKTFFVVDALQNEYGPYHGSALRGFRRDSSGVTPEGRGDVVVHSRCLYLSSGVGLNLTTDDTYIATAPFVFSVDRSIFIYHLFTVALRVAFVVAGLLLLF